MILPFLLLVQAASLPATPPVPPSRPPQDWSALPRFAVPVVADVRLSRFVRGEVAAGRCAAALSTPEGRTVKVDFAVLVDADGRPRSAVPRAIGCPTVEQYAAGALSRMLRAETLDRSGIAPGAWNRTTLVFTWAE